MKAVLWLLLGWFFVGTALGFFVEALFGERALTIGPLTGVVLGIYWATKSWQKNGA